jgi:peroxiredoxin
MSSFSGVINGRRRASVRAMWVAFAAVVLLPGRSAADLPQPPALPWPGVDWAGRMAPDFSLRAVDGRSVRLSDFRGKVVLLNFWATWCAPCRVEMPWLAEFSRMYRSQGLEVVGVAMDDGDQESVERFVRDRHVDYPILLKDQATGDAYGGLRYLPQTFLIAGDGRVLQRSYGVRSKDAFNSDIGRALSVRRR